MFSKKLEPLALAGYKPKEEVGSDAESGSSVGSGSESGSDVGDITDDASSIASLGESDDDATASVGSNESDTEEAGAGAGAGAAVKSPIQNIQDVISKAADAVSSGAAQDAITELVSGRRSGKGSGSKKSRGKGILESIASASASLGLGGSEGEYEGEEGSDEYDSDDDDMDKKLKKFDSEVRDDYLAKFHPECMMQNYDEIYNLARVVRDDRGVIVDELHKTLPLLTKYERTRVLGQRAKQINDGAMPFVKVPEGVIDGYLIALKELEEKKIPFIIRRPLPNRGSEYWHLEDLQIIN
jgi:DNA-directed RNA polymerase I, II, and III subunit RPABC2